MTNYRNGADLERAAKHLLEDNGYFVVKAAGSKGPADLVAIKPGETLIVQCKLDGYLRPAERIELFMLSMRFQVTALVGMWHKNGRAAREVRFRHIVYSDGDLPGYAEWTPDWALEPALSDHRGDRTA